MKDETLRIPARLKDITAACDFVAACAVHAGLDEDAIHHCRLAVDEVCTNIIEHGYGVDNANHFIDFICQHRSDHFIIQIIDDSHPFNPLDHADPDPKAALTERKMGGWGVYFVKKMMDEVTYDYTQGRNRLVIIKRIDPNKPAGNPSLKTLDESPITVTPKMNNTWSVSPSGRVNLSVGRSLEVVIARELEAGHTYLIIDMGKVDYISSGGLKILVSLWKRVRDLRGDLVLAGLTPPVREVITLIGFDLVFTVFKSVDEAVAKHKFGSK